jgi:hypothetical protein
VLVYELSAITYVTDSRGGFGARLGEDMILAVIAEALACERALAQSTLRGCPAPIQTV